MHYKTKSVGINAVLNVIRQVLSVIFPLITFPYALRVLGVESIGKVNYGSSIVGYFSLIAMLGIKSYAIREGARFKEDKTKFEKFASQIFTINVISTVISYIFLAIALTIFKELYSYRTLIILQSISICLTTFGIDWVNSVFEDYLILTIRSIITNLIVFVLLFLFVKGKEDYYIYAFLTVISNGIICLINHIYCRRYVKLRITKSLDLKKHIKPIMILFANAVAITIYVNVDTTMIGIIKGDYSVGLYTAAVKIYNIAKNIMAAIYIVSVPRLSLYASKGQWSEYKTLCTKILSSITLILLPVSIGLICLSSEVMGLIGGVSYVDSSLTLSILGVSLIFAIFGGYFTAAINISLKREKVTLIATVISAIVNFSLNFIFIPILGHNGAAITTLMSELFVFLFCFLYLPHKEHYLDWYRIKKSLIIASSGSVCIIVSYLIFKAFDLDVITRMAIVVIFSVFCYVILLTVLKEEIFCSCIDNIKKKIMQSN